MDETKQSDSLKCSHCGQPLPEGSRYCLVCGAPVGSPGAAPGPEAEAKREDHPDVRPAEAGSGSAAADPPLPLSARNGTQRSLLTLGLVAILIGGIALAAYGLVSATGTGEDGGTGTSPLAGAGLGSDTREAPPDSGGAATDTITPEDEAQPGNSGRDERDGGGGDEPVGGGGGEPADGDGGEPDGGGNPPATGAASPAQALAAAFALAEGETATPCYAANIDDALCYLPYLENLEQQRYLYQVGAPFSEPFAWALVEQQGDGTFETTQTADFDFEGDGTPPFSPGGAMAGIIFTSQLLDDRPIDRFDDGNSPLPAGVTEVVLFIRYTGLEAAAQATVTLDWDGSPLGDPEAIDIDPSGEGWVAFRIAGDDGTEITQGTYTATVFLNGTAIARASTAVIAV